MQEFRMQNAGMQDLGLFVIRFWNVIL